MVVMIDTTWNSATRMASKKLGELKLREKVTAAVAEARSTK